jgi:S1-C subfamily serine protease
LKELTIGRDPGCTIAFDPDRDDLVSRRHAVISVVAHEPPTFKITDNGSANGTKINGRPLTGEGELVPGDTVEAGNGGPRFLFDLDPRPANFAKRTRFMGAAAAPAAVKETRAFASDATVVYSRLPTDPPSRPQTEPPNRPRTDSVSRPQTDNFSRRQTGRSPDEPSTRVGRDTVQRIVRGMVSEATVNTNRRWMYGLSVVLLIVAISGGVLYWQARSDLNRETATLNQTISHISEDVSQKIDETKASVDEKTRKTALTPQEITARYARATTYIEVAWRLYHKPTGKPVFQKRFNIGGHGVPAFVQLKDGTRVRWLTTEEDGNLNDPIQEEETGSGFVLNSAGFIATNKHVAAGWSVRFDDDLTDKVLVFNLGQQIAPKKILNHLVPTDDSMQNWIPQSDGLLFLPDEPTAIAPFGDIFEGRNERLEVRFPNNRISTKAQLVRVSSDADVAIIKIDAINQLTATNLAKSDDPLKVAEHITVLGYPAISEQKISETISTEAGQARKSVEVIPEPTVIDGIISKLGAELHNQGNLTTVQNDMGDAFQLSVQATGAGNSGGPVFNDAGQVVGIFTYSLTDRRSEKVFLAIPIKHVNDLIEPQQVQ